MRARIGMFALLLIAGQSASAFAQDTVKLFKVITAKDDVTIGLTIGELQALGAPMCNGALRHPTLL